MNNKVIIIGAGGHAKVIADILENNNDEIVGFLDDNHTEDVLGYPILGKLSDIDKFINEENKFIIGIGNNNTRKQVAEKYKLNYITAIHPSAVISKHVQIEKGTVVMPKVVINPGAIIGKHCIINTASIVEHDNTLENYVHISPNVALSGTVRIGECTHIGTGASVRNNIDICGNVIIGVGSVVVKDVADSGVYCGVPIKKINY